MNHQASLKVYKAQTKNVHALDQAVKHINRTINNALKIGDRTSASIHTQVLALTYSAWAEVSFSKLIHTPHGLKLTEIQQIKTEQKKGLEKGWEQCVDLALKKVNPKKTGEVSNKRQQLLKIIKQYIIEPSLLRNKIAHGQWAIALNRSNTAVNNESTKSLAALDAVAVNIWFQVYKYLELIVEDLIESPEKTHERDYWLHLTKLEQYLRRTRSWTLEDKVRMLQEKHSHKWKPTRKKAGGDGGGATV